MIGFGLSIIGVAVLVFIAAFTFDIAMRMLQAAAERKLLNDTIDAVMQDERTDEVMNESEQAKEIESLKQKAKNIDPEREP